MSETISFSLLEAHAAQTVAKSYFSDISKRMAVLEGDFAIMGALNTAFGRTYFVPARSKESMCRAAATTFEGRAMQGMKYQDLAKQRHMKKHHNEFEAHCKKMKVSAKEMEDLVHPLIWKTVQAVVGT